jgi:cystathionine beta-lyase
VAEPNTFAIEAAIAAFTKCEYWLDELRSYIYENKKTVSEYIELNIPQLKLVPSQATYLLWINCEKVGKSSYVADFIRKETGLYLTAGRQYRGDGDGFLRLNIACPRSVLKDGLERLKNGVEKIKI